MICGLVLAGGRSSRAFFNVNIENDMQIAIAQGKTVETGS